MAAPQRFDGKAAVLAELLDTALSDEWGDERPMLAVLSQPEADGGDVELAIKRIDRHPAAELAAFPPEDACLAICHSSLETAPSTPDEAGPSRAVRVTVAVDRAGGATFVRHRHEGVRRSPTAEGPVGDVLRRWLPAPPGDRPAPAAAPHVVASSRGWENPLAS